MHLNSFKVMDGLTREKVKMSMVVCCVRVNVALSFSHDPDEFVSLGVRLTNDCIVWGGRYTHILFQVGYKGGVYFLQRDFLGHKAVFHLIL